ncbi:MAG TPA: hypothetical protein VK974_03565 [Methylophilaceae bacterium]|nr:hypothetical protein [Methylophilaceae bacterium]
MNSSSVQNFLQILDEISDATADQEVVSLVDDFLAEHVKIASVERRNHAPMFAGKREFLVTFTSHEDAACAGVTLNSHRYGRFRRHGYYGLVIELG